MIGLLKYPPKMKCISNHLPGCISLTTRGLSCLQQLVHIVSLKHKQKQKPAHTTGGEETHQAVEVLIRDELSHPTPTKTTWGDMNFVPVVDIDGQRYQHEVQIEVVLNR